MNVVVFTKAGHVAPVLLQRRKTVKAKWYFSTCLPKSWRLGAHAFQKTDTCSQLLHHDNTSAHTATASLDYLEDSCVQLVTCPSPPPLVSWT